VKVTLARTDRQDRRFTPSLSFAPCVCLLTSELLCLPSRPLDVDRPRSCAHCSSISAAAVGRSSGLGDARAPDCRHGDDAARATAARRDVAHCIRGRRQSSAAVSAAVLQVARHRRAQAGQSARRIGADDRCVRPRISIFESHALAALVMKRPSRWNSCGQCSSSSATS